MIDDRDLYQAGADVEADGGTFPTKKSHDGEKDCDITPEGNGRGRGCHEALTDAGY